MGKKFALAFKITLSCLILIFTDCKAYASLESSQVKKVQVVSSGLNIRLGAGINYKAVAQAFKGDILEVIGLEKGWYLIRTTDGVYGMVYKDYIKISEAEPAPSESLPQGSNDLETQEPETDLEIAFAIVNELRAANGLSPFEYSDELNAVAMAKAQDMVENKYFSHDSPVYGTPFKMLKTFQIEYNTASENIARNSSVEEAFKDMMASPAHRGNILNSRFTKIGLGICESSFYGKIIVLIFVG